MLDFQPGAMTLSQAVTCLRNGHSLEVIHNSGIALWQIKTADRARHSSFLLISQRRTLSDDLHNARDPYSPPEDVPC